MVVKYGHGRWSHMKVPERRTSFTSSLGGWRGSVPVTMERGLLLLSVVQGDSQFVEITISIHVTYH